jgi:hypothetical protein
VFRRELLRLYLEFCREGTFPESKLSGFCSCGIQNTQSTSGNRFFCSGGILFTQSTMWVLISCCFIMSGAFLYQSCLKATLYRKTFELTLSNSAPLRLLSVFYFPQSKIEYRRSKNCSAGNPPPNVNPGLKCTRTDAILKNLIKNEF